MTAQRGGIEFRRAAAGSGSWSASNPCWEPGGPRTTPETACSGQGHMAVRIVAASSSPIRRRLWP